HTGRGTAGACWDEGQRSRGCRTFGGVGKRKSHCTLCGARLCLTQYTGCHYILIQGNGWRVVAGTLRWLGRRNSAKNERYANGNHKQQQSRDGKAARQGTGGRGGRRMGLRIAVQIQPMMLQTSRKGVVIFRGGFQDLPVFQAAQGGAQGSGVQWVIALA